MRLPLPVLATVGLVITPLLWAQTPRHDRDHVYLHSTATQNNLWVFDHYCSTTVPGQPTIVPPISNLLSSSAGHSPSSIHVDREGYLWIVDSANNEISKFLAPPNSAASLLQFRVPLGPQYSGIRDFRFGPDGNPYVLCSTSSTAGVLVRIDRNNVAPVLTQIPWLPSGHGPANLFCLHTDGTLYLLRTTGANNGVLTRVRPVGSQLVESYFWTSLTQGPRGYGLSEGPDGNLRVTDAALNVIDQQTGSVIARQVSPNGGAGVIGNPIVFPIDATTAEAWCVFWDGGAYYGPTRFMFRANVLTHMDRWYYDAAAKNYTFDGCKRLYVVYPSGGVYWSNLGRTGGSTLNYSIPASSVWGDPTGFARAVSVDKAWDDDGDGVTNLVEVAAGSDPFDPASTPTTANTCFLHVTSPLSINSPVTFSLAGVPGNGYYVFLGLNKLTSGLTIPPFKGQLLVGGGIFELFSSLNKPFNVIPPGGVVRFTTGIPNNPSLIGTYQCQAITFPDPPATGFSNLATLDVR